MSPAYILTVNLKKIFPVYLHSSKLYYNIEILKLVIDSKHFTKFYEVFIMHSCQHHPGFSKTTKHNSGDNNEA